MKKEILLTYIGGIPTPIKEKQAILKNMDTKIKEILNGKLTTISLYEFAQGYPESIDFVKKYYDALRFFYKKNPNVNSKFSSYLEIQKDIQTKENLTRYIYVPLMEDRYSFKRTITILNMPIGLAEKVINAKKNMEKGLPMSGEYDFNVRKKIVNTFFNDMLRNNYSKDQLITIFHTSKEKFNEYFLYLEQINPSLYKKIKIQMSSVKEDLNQTYLEITHQIYQYLLTNKTYNGHSVRFELIDYLNLTHISIRNLYIFVRQSQLITDHEERVTVRDFISRYLQNDVLLNEDIALSRHYRLGNSEQVIDVTENLIKSIYRDLESHHVLNYEIVIMEAMKRKIYDIPLFPYESEKLVLKKINH